MAKNEANNNLMREYIYYLFRKEGYVNKLDINKIVMIMEGLDINIDSKEGFIVASIILNGKLDDINNILVKEGYSRLDPKVKREAIWIYFLTHRNQEKSPSSMDTIETAEY